jgi:hypothetical protein
MRAQHYRHLAAEMLKSAREESSAKRQRQFLDLASQYGHLADRLVAQSTGQRHGAAFSPGGV